MLIHLKQNIVLDRRFDAFSFLWLQVKAKILCHRRVTKRAEMLLSIKKYMAKVFSVLSWNIKHFGTEQTRLTRIINEINTNDPDVIGIYEVRGAAVYEQMTSIMTDYNFHITEGPQSQEILVGVKRSIQSFFTQKTEFKSGVKTMRPGLLVSLKIDDIHYSLLFLHLASLTKPRGMGLRDDMMERSFKLKRAIHNMAVSTLNQDGKFIFLGDLNTMGLEYPYGKDIDASFEIKRLDGRASRNTMKRLKKTHELTYYPGSTSSYSESNLDHVVATKNINFKSFKDVNQDDCSVLVKGWVDEAAASDKDTWRRDFSDHAYLYFEVHD